MASTLESSLRKTTLVSFVFALALLTPATVESVKHNFDYWSRTRSVIGFGFIPLFFTVFTSVGYLVRERIRKHWAASSAAPLTSHPLLWVTADFMIFCGYLAVLVSEWTKGMNRLSSYPNLAFLEAYATVPLMLNMCVLSTPLLTFLAHPSTTEQPLTRIRVIHLITININIKPAVRFLLAATAATPRECPHCHHRMRSGCVDEVVQKESGEGYSLLRGEEYDDDAGRASTSSEAQIALPTADEV
jgi:hypothetical protein